MDLCHVRTEGGPWPNDTIKIMGTIRCRNAPYLRYQSRCMPACAYRGISVSWWVEENIVQRNEISQILRHFSVYVTPFVDWNKLLRIIPGQLIQSLWKGDHSRCWCWGLDVRPEWCKSKVSFRPAQNTLTYRTNILYGNTYSPQTSRNPW